jgi:branched-chain amino acid transport system substrate-binding protein
LTDLTAASGMGPSLLDASMYDATVALALAALKASVGLSDPSTVTGAQVQQALSQINDPNGTIVRTGTEAFKQAIPLISAGAAINYDGASGPVDFDSSGNIFQNLSLYQGQAGAFVDVQKFDCVTSPSCLALP